VLQHIPVSRGEKIIQQLIDRLNPGGVLAIQFPFRRKASALRKSIVKLRENLAPVAWLLNMIRGRRWNEPLMQMNDYDLNRILRILSDSGINDVFIEIENSSFNYSAFVFARRPAV
jgi:trans-aconitate methyltransferase